MDFRKIYEPSQHKAARAIHRDLPASKKQHIKDMGDSIAYEFDIKRADRKRLNDVLYCSILIK